MVEYCGDMIVDVCNEPSLILHKKRLKLHINRFKCINIRKRV